MRNAVVLGVTVLLIVSLVALTATVIIIALNDVLEPYERETPEMFLDE